MTGGRQPSPSSAREVALQVLEACSSQAAWSDGYLKRVLRQVGLDRRDAALATRLCFGVLQSQMLLDWHLAHFSRLPLGKLESQVLWILRLAVYQLLYLDKIPPSAAVNEAVNQARAHSRNPRTAGMVNGILRAMLRAMPLPAAEGVDDLDTLSIQTSHPRWLVEAFAQRLGIEEAKALLETDNAGAPTTVQVNRARITPEALCRRLEEEGAHVQIHPWMPGCLTLEGSGNLEVLESFRQGLFYVQDVGARMAVLAAAPEPGQRLLDCCAAPGGKSFGAALEMENRGEVVCCDIHPHKIQLLAAGRSRLGLDCLRPMVQDAAQTRQDWLGNFDRVIADVPCSGLGIIRKKPDIRYKPPGPLAELPEIQWRILSCVSGYLKPGGVLVYSTCTLLQRENEDVVARFLSEHREFALEPFELPHLGRQEGMVTLWPHIHGTDGFFIARLRKDR